MTRPIKILHVLGNLDRGGAESLVMNLFRHIDRSLIHFDFVVHTTHRGAYQDEVERLGGKVYVVPKYQLFNHRSYIRAWKGLFLEQQGQYDIIHAHIRSTAAIFLPIARSFGLITIAHSHAVASRGVLLERFVKYVLQLPLRKSADHYLACSMSAGRWLFGDKIIKSASFSILKNAINIKEFIFDPDKRNAQRKALGFENHNIVGHIGNFTDLKNHSFLIRVFASLKETLPEVKLCLVGEGDLKPEIEREVKELHLQEDVVFLGVRSDIGDLLQAFDVFVFPSKSEGLGIAVIEAQAADLPCVVSDGVPDEVNILSNIQFLSLSDGVKVWAQRIAALFPTHDRKNTSEDTLESGYGIDYSCKQLTALYQNLITGSK